MNKKKCPRCHEVLRDAFDMRYCYECGKKLVK